MITILLTLLVVAVLLWLNEKFMPDQTIKFIVKAVLVIATVIWLLKDLGLMQYITSLKI